MSSHPPRRDPGPGSSPSPVAAAAGASGAAIGTRLVLGLLLAAVGLAMFAVWFQWGQTRRCLSFFGPAAARSIQTAPRVELWSLAAQGATVRASSRLDVSRAPGLVHLRRGLIEDVNYRWNADDSRWKADGLEPPGPLAIAAWDEAIAFFDPADSPVAVAVVAFDLDGPDGSGRLPFATVVGRPGRVALGPLAPGLRRWIEATKTGFRSAK